MTAAGPRAYGQAFASVAAGAPQQLTRLLRKLLCVDRSQARALRLGT